MQVVGPGLVARVSLCILLEAKKIEYCQNILLKVSYNLHALLP